MPKTAGSTTWRTMSRRPRPPRPRGIPVYHVAKAGPPPPSQGDGMRATMPEAPARTARALATETGLRRLGRRWRTGQTSPSPRRPRGSTMPRTSRAVVEGTGSMRWHEGQGRWPRVPRRRPRQPWRRQGLSTPWTQRTSRTARKSLCPPRGVARREGFCLPR